MTSQTAQRLLLAAALALVLPAAAAAQLVANTGQTAASGTLEVGGSSNWANALTFTTGGHTAGYTLSAVDVVLAAGTPLTATRVTIYETTGTPAAPTGTGLHVLNNPTTLTASATNTFTANAGATLAASTTYAVVVDRSSGSGSTSLAKTTSNAEDSGAASGWSIGDKRHFRQGTGSWSESTDAEKLLIAIKGTLVRTVTADPTTIGAGRDTDVTFSFSGLHGEFVGHARCGERLHGAVVPEHECGRDHRQ